MRPEMSLSSDNSLGSIDFKLTIQDFDKELSEKSSVKLKDTMSFKPGISK
jgi:hypothetical protein